MYICLCNPFTDKDVKKALHAPEVPNTPAQIYKSCSGGQGPNCGQCLCEIKNMIVDHHAALGVDKIKHDLSATSETALVTASANPIEGK